MIYWSMSYMAHMIDEDKYVNVPENMTDIRHNYIKYRLCDNTWFTVNLNYRIARRGFIYVDNPFCLKDITVLHSQYLRLRNCTDI